MRVQLDAVFVPLNIAVLTVSDTRTYDNDTSGALLANRSVEV
ncbi:molybdenum cofactor biosynthesis protein, partial [Enterococcus faecium]